MLIMTSMAVPPRDWNYLKSKPSDFHSCRPISHAMRESLKMRGAIRKAGTRKVISPASPKILVIRVTFSDCAGFIDSWTQQQAFFTNFRGYFSENSYGLVQCSATLTNVMPLGSVSLYNNETDEELLRLKTDAVNAALSNGVNFAPYDYIMIYHAGFGEEESRNSNDLWSLFFGTSFSVQTKSFDGFTVVPERSPSGSSSLGVVCHEFGHQLGLPDLYNTSFPGGRSTCGAWTLMDYPYGADNSGINPPHLDPWCKNNLNYIDLDTRIISGDNNNLLMGDIETSGATGYYKIPTEINANEYFIMEYREPSKVVFDHSLPGSGILMWHIDTALINARIDSNTINNDPSHPAIDLVEADYPVTPVYPPGRAANAFHGSDTFGNPLSDTFTGQPTGITITDFRLSTGYAEAKSTKLGVTTSIALTKATSYPNPAGKGYPHPRQSIGIISTIVFHASQPPRVLTMGLYTLAGERLLTVPKSGFNLQLAKSGDYSWVYEFDWNGKNESAEAVAPGLYFYRIKADKEIKAGKIAVVR